MLTWEQFLNEQAKKQHDFSSTQINLPDGLAEKIIAWGKENIDEKDLHEKGMEDEIHVTVLYGLHAEKSDDVEKALKGTRPFAVQLDKTSMFDAPDFDVLKIGVISPELHDLNAKLAKDCEHTKTHPKYIPHVTIAYLKKGKGKKHINKDVFADCGFLADEVLFSNKVREKTKISLN